MIRLYLLNVLVALDQLVSAILGGDPDETISSRLGKSQRGDYGRAQRMLLMPAAMMVDLVFLKLDGPDHCRRMIEDDEGSRAVPFPR